MCDYYEFAVENEHIFYLWERKLNKNYNNYFIT